MLSALVSGLVSADMLMIFTDVNGLYDKNPQKNEDAKNIISFLKLQKKSLLLQEMLAQNLGLAE